MISSFRIFANYANQMTQISYSWYWNWSTRMTQKFKKSNYQLCTSIQSIEKQIASVISKNIIIVIISWISIVLMTIFHSANLIYFLLPFDLLKKIYNLHEKKKTWKINIILAIVLILLRIYSSMKKALVFWFFFVRFQYSYIISF